MTSFSIKLLIFIGTLMAFSSVNAYSPHAKNLRFLDVENPNKCRHKCNGDPLGIMWTNADTAYCMMRHQGVEPCCKDTCKRDCKEKKGVKACEIKKSGPDQEWTSLVKAEF